MIYKSMEVLIILGLHTVKAIKVPKNCFNTNIFILSAEIPSWKREVEGAKTEEGGEVRDCTQEAIPLQKISQEGMQ